MITSFKQSGTRPSRTRARSLILAALIVGALSPAWGQNIYTTGFEKPTFLPGTVLAGQDGWIAPVPVLSPNAAMITAAKKNYEGGQTVQVAGADLVSQPDAINAATGGYYDAIGSYRHPVDYDTGGTQTVRISADVRLDGRTTPHSNFFSASIVAIAYNTGGGSEGVGELAISSDGYVYGYSGQDAVPVFLTSKHVAQGRSHHLAVEVDFAARTYSFYVDDDFLGKFAFEPFVPSGVLRRGSMIAYAAPDTARDKKADHAANFDNFSIKVAPKKDRDHNDGNDHHDGGFDERD